MQTKQQSATDSQISDSDIELQDSEKLYLLGDFMYGEDRVIMVGTGDEHKYSVYEYGSCVVGEQKVKTTDFSDLRIARHFFEEQVLSIVGRMSFSTISIFSQQRAPRWNPPSEYV